jgi:glycosyltransferase involved in cell wall biosynthesis
MSGPAVSIIIPCFNRAAMVADAIRSALDQVPDVEVIVIDDGSTDDSWRVISSFTSIVTKRTANRGVSAARNRGIELASGQFIQFLDSDDLLPAGATAAMLAAASQLNPREIAVGAAKVQSSSPNPPKYGFGAWWDAGPIPPPLLLRHPMPSGLPLFPRAALTEAGGFDERLTIGEDYVLAVRLHSLGYRFVQQPIAAYVVRDHGGERLSRGYGAAGFRNLLATYREALAVLGLIGSDERRSIGQALWVHGRNASREGFRAEAEALFALAAGLEARGVRVGPAPLQLLYRLVPPYVAEWLLERAKRAVRRAA